MSQSEKGSSSMGDGKDPAGKIDPTPPAGKGGAGYAANPPHKESTSVHTASGASVSVGAPVSGSDGGGLTGGQQRDNSSDMAGMATEGVGHAAEYAKSKTRSLAEEQKTAAASRNGRGAEALRKSASQLPEAGQSYVAG